MKCLACFLLFFTTSISAQELTLSPVRSIAILGDSLSTGAASHPALAFDGKVLWQVFNGERRVAAQRSDLPADLLVPADQELARPMRLWPTSREFFGGPDWVYRNTLQILSRAYLDTEEYSWGYIAGVGLGVPAERILIAGEDGARVESMPRHLDRVLATTDGVWPERVMILYTGNDLCGLSMGQVTTTEDFEAALTDGFEYLMANGRAAAGGTEVDLLSYLSILQLLNDDSILAKQIETSVGKISCKELRASGYRPRDANDPAKGASIAAPTIEGAPWFFSMFMPPNPAAFCPTLFGQLEGAHDDIVGQLANRIRDYREAEVRAIDKAQQRAKALGVNVRFRHMMQTASVHFDGDDIAADCFHLSPRGQAKVAKAVLSDGVSH